jgi:hypothetical protein
MSKPHFPRLALVGGALALILAPALASGQDGKPPVGPSTNAPETNKNNPANPPGGVESPRPKRPEEVLPAVPATARDPAPPGTRSVRVDLPPATTAPATPVTNRSPRGIKVVEGVVTRVGKPAKDLTGEIMRIRVNGAKTWDDHVLGPARPKTATARSAANDPDRAIDDANSVDIVLTRRTYIFAHARTVDGVDLYGVATESSPFDNRARSDATTTHIPVNSPGNRADKETNFTNIREGSYVLVRYRTTGNLNEATNVSLIEMPLNPPRRTDISAPGVNPAGRTVPGNVPGAPRVPSPPSAANPGVLPR